MKYWTSGRDKGTRKICLASPRCHSLQQSLSIKSMQGDCFWKPLRCNYCLEDSLFFHKYDIGWDSEFDKNNEWLFTFSKTNWKVHVRNGAWEWKVSQQILWIRKSKSESLILQAKLTVQEEIQLWREDRVSS